MTQKESGGLQRNLKLEIEYDGTNYCGWQIQKGHQVTKSQSHKSIQETIEKALQKILQEKVKLIASGRTDAGVHALAQVANFKTKSNISTDKLHGALNSVLPDDVIINKIEEVGADFHSRFVAKSKLYRYLILNRHYPSALLKNKVYFYPHPLNIALMRQEARHLLGRHDFKAFSASACGRKTTVRKIKDISIYRFKGIVFNTDGSLIAIDIEAEGFLYNMARRIIGTLLDIGRGRLAKGHIKIMLETKDRTLGGITAQAQGLYLVKVNY